MTQIIKKWGNSPSVRLNTHIMKEASLSINDEVDIKVADGVIMITPIKNKEKTLNELLALINGNNIHDEVDFGYSVGKELL